jgi:mannose-6-phosphate isomerase-like protein (cupin superfamily)
MDELDRVLSIALTGKERDHAVADFKECLDKWQLYMPPAEAIVEDFGLGNFRKVGLIECWIANETRAGYCGKFLFVFDGQQCPEHHHRAKHETFHIVRGKVQMSLDGEIRIMSPGDVLAIPPGQRHSFQGIGPTLLLEISQPCFLDDNYFSDTRIPIGGNFGRP